LDFGTPERFQLFIFIKEGISSGSDNTIFFSLHSITNQLVAHLSTPSHKTVQKIKLFYFFCLETFHFYFFVEVDDEVVVLDVG